jgi:hypothetical protein
MIFLESIIELGSLSDNSIFKKDKIEWWLHKYAEYYNHYYEENRNRSGMKITHRADASTQTKQFYFKEELEVYNNLKNNVKEVNSWLEAHKLGKRQKYQEFVSLFQNTSTLSGYGFELFEPYNLPFKITLDELEFEYTLQFLKILDSVNKVEIIGAINIINDIEVIKRSNLPNYNRQTIVVNIENGHGSELLIIFLHEKVQMLKNLKVGQKVKVYVELLGGKSESEKSGYSVFLKGWDLEVLKN